MSKSVDDMGAYLWVTDEVLHQIRTIELQTVVQKNLKTDIEDAIDILDRIHRRDLYRLVGENKITWRDPEVHIRWQYHNHFIKNFV